MPGALRSFLFCKQSQCTSTMARMDRRSFLALGAAALTTSPSLFAEAKSEPQSLQTPYKLNRLVLGPSNTAGAFDEKSVDCPFVFRNGKLFYMTFVAFDGKRLPDRPCLLHQPAPLEESRRHPQARPQLAYPQIQRRHELDPPRERHGIHGPHSKDQRSLRRRVSRLPKRGLRAGRSRHRPRLQHQRPHLGSRPTNSSPRRRSIMGTRRPLQALPAPLRRQVLPLLQRQGSHHRQLERTNRSGHLH